MTLRQIDSISTVSVFNRKWAMSAWLVRDAFNKSHCIRPNEYRICIHYLSGMGVMNTVSVRNRAQLLNRTPSVYAAFRGFHVERSPQRY